MTQACKACAASKLKCAEEKPCRRCRQKNIACEFSQPATTETTDLEGARGEPDLQDEYMFPEGGPETNNAPNHGQFLAPGTLTPTRSSSQLTDGVLELDASFFPGFLRDVMVPSNFEFPQAEYPAGYLNQGFTPRGFMDYGTEVSFELDDGDFDYLDAFNAKNTIHVVPPMDSGNSTVSPAQVFDSGNRSTHGAARFRNSSLATYAPGHRSHGYAGTQQLALPNAADSPEARSTFDWRILSERLTPSSRDKILGMVLDNCSTVNIAKIVASFPSVEILDNLIQYFFGWQVSQIENWIHQPTFRTNSQRPELLGMIAAAGAARTSVPTVRKLGFALQEAVRLAIPKLVRPFRSFPALLLIVRSLRQTTPPERNCQYSKPIFCNSRWIFGAAAERGSKSLKLLHSL